jgi:CubicO group peptidase (beta-lactamase class C family)
MPRTCFPFPALLLLALLLPAGLEARQGAPAAPEVAEVLRLIEGPRTPDVAGPEGLPLAELLEAAGVPGISVAVVHDFQLHWSRGYGVADVETGAAVGQETLFQAASISKPVTAMAALRLAREGRLDLDGDVNHLLRSWQVPARPEHGASPVTPRSLFSHTSGADDGFGFPGYDPDAPRPDVVGILNGDAPSNVGPVRFARAPYQAYKYSGGGTTIMQLALTESTGRPFPALMEEAVLAPLGMSASSYEQPLPPHRAPRASRAHDGQGQARSAPWHVYPEQAAAGLWTTSADLARFIAEVQQAVRGPEGAVLDRASALEMITPVGVGPFGVGLTVEKRGEGWYFGHTGSNRGFRGLILGHVRKGYGVAILTNADNGGEVIGELLLRVAGAYGWDMLDEPLRR